MRLFGTTKGGGGQYRSFFLQARVAKGDLEHFPDLLGENALALHSKTEPGIVEAAAVNGADAPEDFVAPTRFIRIEPGFEHGGDGERQAHDFRGGPAGPDAGDGLRGSRGVAQRRPGAAQ